MATLAFAQQSGRGPGINLSLWKGLSTQRADTVRSTLLNVGIASVVGNLHGLGINALGGVTINNAYGLQLAGITQVAGDSMCGLSLSGLVGIVGDDAQGLMASGLLSIAGGQMQGVSVGGLMNISGNDAQGFQLGGLAAITGNDMQGVSVGGLINVATDRAEGLQAASLLNVAGDSLAGAQVGLVNVAVNGRGLQIGLVNYCHHRFKGIQLGLINANRFTRYQLMLYGGNHTKLNAALRVMNRRLYTIVGVGAPYLKFSDRFSGSLFYRAGLSCPLGTKVRVSGDLGYQHIELFKNRSKGFPKRLYALQGRVNAEYHLNSRYGVFGSVGYGYDRHYGKNATFDHGVIVEGGIVLLKL